MSTIPDSLIRQVLADAAPKIAGPKRGDEIFEGTDYPRTWDGFIGQEEAVEQLHVAVGSAKARGTRLDHTLLTGPSGMGKTTLAYLLAYTMGVGVTSTSGPLTMEKARDMIRVMEDGDILFHDETHTLVTGNRNRADWLLPFLTDGKFYTDKGAEKMPDVTVVGATTDVGKLPVTLQRRFLRKPALSGYTLEQAARICQQMSIRLDVDVPADALEAIARAASHNPGTTQEILTAIRDLNYAYPDTHPNLEKAFGWAGMSADGLSQIARDMLLLLLGEEKYTASIDTLKGKLSESGPIGQHEQMLFQRALLTITGRGRKLTDAGIVRAREEAITRS